MQAWPLGILLYGKTAAGSIPCGIGHARHVEVEAEEVGDQEAVMYLPTNFLCVQGYLHGLSNPSSQQDHQACVQSCVSKAKENLTISEQFKPFEVLASTLRHFVLQGITLQLAQGIFP